MHSSHSTISCASPERQVVLSSTPDHLPFASGDGARNGASCSSPFSSYAEGPHVLFRQIWPAVP